MAFLFCFKPLSGGAKPFGPECAKPCRYAGAFTLKIGRALCLARHRQTTLPPSAPSHSAKQPIFHCQMFPSPFRYVCPELLSQAGQGGTPLDHWSLQTLYTPGQRSRFDAASPIRHSGCRIRMLFMDTLAYPITNQRYSPHTHGKCTEKASFFIATNRQRRKGCDKKKVSE